MVPTLAQLAVPKLSVGQQTVDCQRLAAFAGEAWSAFAECQLQCAACNAGATIGAQYFAMWQQRCQYTSEHWIGGQWAVDDDVTAGTQFCQALFAHQCQVKCRERTTLVNIKPIRIDELALAFRIRAAAWCERWQSKRLLCDDTL
jgi:hypothetical protein